MSSEQVRVMVGSVDAEAWMPQMTWAEGMHKLEWHDARS